LSSFFFLDRHAARISLRGKKSFEAYRSAQEWWRDFAIAILMLELWSVIVGRGSVEVGLVFLYLKKKN